MVSSAAKTVEAYLAELPPERREVVATLREVVNAHLQDGYREAMNYGMIVWCVPLARYPNTYNKQPLAYAALAAQKNHYSLYLMCVYEDDRRERSLRAAAATQGKPLDMGKSCIRFKRIDQLPIEAIGEVIASLSVDEFIALYERARASAGVSKAVASPSAASKTASKNKAASSKAASSKAVSKTAASKSTVQKQAAPKSMASRSTAAQSKPARSTPAQSTPARSTPARSTPARSSASRSNASKSAASNANVRAAAASNAANNAANRATPTKPAAKRAKTR